MDCRSLSNQNEILKLYALCTLLNARAYTAGSLALQDKQCLYNSTGWADMRALGLLDPVQRWVTTKHFIPRAPEVTAIIHLDSSVGIALGYGLDDRSSRVRFSEGAGNFSLHHRVQNGSGAHPPSYPMGTWGSIPGGKVAGAWSWPLTSI
jgi:hypothetical protein